MTEKEKKERQFILEYEIATSRITSLFPWNWTHQLIARYYSDKVTRKYNRLIEVRTFRNEYGMKPLIEIISKES